MHEKRCKLGHTYSITSSTCVLCVDVGLNSNCKTCISSPASCTSCKIGDINSYPNCENTDCYTEGCITANEFATCELNKYYIHAIDLLSLYPDSKTICSKCNQT